jgi:hypothetical protein
VEADLAWETTHGAGTDVTENQEDKVEGVSRKAEGIREMRRGMGRFRF